MDKKYILNLYKAISEILESKDWDSDSKKVKELNNLADELKIETDVKLIMQKY